MLPEKLPNGNIRTLRRARDEESGIVGDGIVEITPEDSEYSQIEAWINSPEYKRQELMELLGRDVEDN